MVQHHGLLAFPSGWLKDVFLECTNIQFELHHVADSASAPLCQSPLQQVQYLLQRRRQATAFFASGGYRKITVNMKMSFFFPPAQKPKPQTSSTPNSKQRLFLRHEVSRRTGNFDALGSRCLKGAISFGNVYIKE